MPILVMAEIQVLHEAAVGARLIHSRSALLAGIDAAVVAGIPLAANPREQIWIDLHYLNDADSFTSGRVPLQLWLATAVSLSKPYSVNSIFTRYLLRVTPVRPEVSRTGASHTATARATHRSMAVAPRSEARPDAAFNSTVYIPPPPRRTPFSRGGSWLSSLMVVTVTASMIVILGVAYQQLSSTPSGEKPPSMNPAPTSVQPASSPARPSLPAPTTPAPAAPSPSAPDFVPLIWDPLRPECPTDPPEIILGDCATRRDIEWLQRELRTLRSKGVECLSGLPESFVLKPDESRTTGIKNYYLNIYDSTGRIIVGNVWLKSEGLSVTDHTRNPYPRVVLMYSRDETWWIARSMGRVRVP